MANGEADGVPSTSSSDNNNSTSSRERRALGKNEERGSGRATVRPLLNPLRHSASLHHDVHLLVAFQRLDTSVALCSLFLETATAAATQLGGLNGLDSDASRAAKRCAAAISERRHQRWIEQEADVAESADTMIADGAGIIPNAECGPETFSFPRNKERTAFEAQP